MKVRPSPVGINRGSILQNDPLRSRMLSPHVHVGKVDGVGFRNHSKIEGCFESWLVPAGVGSSS